MTAWENKRMLTVWGTSQQRMRNMLMKQNIDKVPYSFSDSPTKRRKEEYDLQSNIRRLRRLSTLAQKSKSLTGVEVVQLEQPKIKLKISWKRPEVSIAPEVLKHRWTSNLRYKRLKIKLKTGISGGSRDSGGFFCTEGGTNPSTRWFNDHNGKASSRRGWILLVVTR